MKEAKEAKEANQQHWNIAEVLRSWRGFQGLSVRDAARAIGLTSATYSRIERGYNADGETLGRVLRWLLSR